MSKGDLLAEQSPVSSFLETARISRKEQDCQTYFSFRLAQQFCQKLFFLDSNVEFLCVCVFLDQEKKDACLFFLGEK